MDQNSTWYALKNFTVEEFSALQESLMTGETGQAEEFSLLKEINNADADTYKTIQFTIQELSYACVFPDTKNNNTNKIILKLREECTLLIAQAAEEGHPEAMHTIGMLYLMNSANSNYINYISKAFEWLNKTVIKKPYYLYFILQTIYRPDEYPDWLEHLYQIYQIINPYINKTTNVNIIKLQGECWKYWFSFCDMRRTAGSKGATLYHYTSLAALEKILPKSAQDRDDNNTKPRLLLTHISAMNDPQEGRYLLNWLRVRASSKEADGEQDSQTEDANQHNIDLANDEIFNIFMTSFSAKPDNLSQWRAYGDDAAGVALAFTTNNLVSNWSLFPEPLNKPTSEAGKVIYRAADTALHLFGKVSYIDLENIKDEIEAEKDVRNILTQAQELLCDQSLTKEWNAIYSALSLLAAFVKHPDYKDEEEYRYAAIGGAIEFYKNAATDLTTPCRYCEDDWFLQNKDYEYTICLGPKVAYADNIKLAIRSRLKDLNNLTIKKSAINYR